ncbi:hypothetical protein Tco_1339880 [Tanacetum coccineum]
MVDASILGEVSNALGPPLPLFEELSRAADSHVTKDQLIAMLQREVVEDAGKVTEFHRLSSETREAVRRRDGYISKLKMSRSCDDALRTIEMLRHMQLDDMEKASCLLLMMMKTQLKAHENTRFIAKMRGLVVLVCRFSLLYVTVDVWLLREAVKTSDWVDMLVFYYRKTAVEDRKFARQISRLREEMVAAYEKRMYFFEELESVVRIIVPAKATEFLNETQMKDNVKLGHLHDLERQTKLRAIEKELFIQKQLRYVPF